MSAGGPFWDVTPFSAASFRAALAAAAHAGAARQDQQWSYLEQYLLHIGAQTIVVEHHYVDRDYLEDFAGYYVRCFEAFQRTCTRLHFFGSAFTANDLTGLLRGDGTLAEADLRGVYLGFVVAKPLPKTIIGRTCLKTYGDEPRRQFPITRTYAANMFGIGLSVDSLAFQQQDQVAAACATSALWSAFQGTGVLFQHHIPSPVEITSAATAVLTLDRALPSKGLNTFQMANAIKHVGLEPLLLRVADDEHVWKATAYAYLRGGVPVLVTGELIDSSKPKAEQTMGKHAVVLAGYSVGPTPVPSGLVPTYFTASRIDRFYCHDDQIGPFARMTCRQGQSFYFETEWLDAAGAKNVHLVPEHTLVPLYHKVRVPFAAVRLELFTFEALQANLRALSQNAAATSQLFPYIEWDIFLTTVNQVKTELLHSVPEAPVRRFLDTPMPRFIWRARGTVNDVARIEFLFDATGIETSNCCFAAIEWDPTTGDIFRTLCQDSAIRAQLEALPAWRLLSRMIT